MQQNTKTTLIGKNKMAATLGDIKGWIGRGQNENQDYLIVVCDTFDWDDFPVFVSGDLEKLQREYNSRKGRDMQKVVEVYDLNADINVQLRVERAFPEGLTK